MFGINKTKTLVKKDIIKKINYQLTNNFFSIQEFIELPFKKAYKVVKLISKINHLQLSRTEIKLITNQMKTIIIKKEMNNEQVESISTFFNWKISIAKTEKTKVAIFFEYLISYLFIFRLHRKKILRI